ncbi:MAG: radical SAM protein [Deltaproteobacteria bacterium]|nr:radical SAM protein [Deltaproteobacteria bacterium]
MTMRIYLIHPKTPENLWAMQGALDIVGKKAIMQNSALLTLIALTPADCDVEYCYCDENIAPIDWSMACDLVGITGYTLQFERMGEISRRFRDRGIPIAAGGVYASIDPEGVGKIADHLFIGEAEYTWPAFLRDWTRGRARAVYRQETFIDMKDSPPPDISHIRPKDYHYFSLQTSRGCPNNCDFCDVVHVSGRKYRSKSIDRIMVELKNAQAWGAETVFFSDDNFVVNRSFTVALLKEIIAWNRTLARPVSFSTQATIMIGEDGELVKLLADARFKVIFLGLETINKDCLYEVNKGQMARYDPFEVIPRLSSHGIVPFLGLIVGFDHDTPAVFQEIEDFLDKTASPIATISILNAPNNTPLYDRMKAQGRLNEDFRGFWHLTTNIIPKNLTIKELYYGQKALFKKIYEPEHFERRMIGWLTNVVYLTDLYSTRRKNFFRIFMIARIFRHFTFRAPPAVRTMFRNVLKAAWRINPRLISPAISMLVQYWHYYDFSQKESWQKAGLDEQQEKECEL